MVWVKNNKANYLVNEYSNESYLVIVDITYSNLELIVIRIGATN